MSAAVGLTALIPLFGACAAFVLGPRGARAAGLLTAAVTTGLCVAVAAHVAAEGPLRTDVGGWAPPLGIALRVDGLSAAMLLMGAVVGAGTSVYAGAWFAADDRPWRGREAFWPLWLALWAALNALFVSADVFNVYVALELLTVAAVSLVVLEGGAEAIRGALRYLLAALLGALAVLLGVALLYGAYGTLDVALLAQRVEPGWATAVAAAAILMGVGLKAAMFPLHAWLPSAHANAQAPVSALLSTLVVTACWYLALRLTIEVFAPATGDGAAIALGVLGALAVVVASLVAARQRSLKLLIAYSTVAQVGYLFVAVPIVLGDPDAAAGTGAALQAVSHALAKAGMFLAAGGVLIAVGHDRMSGLRGLAAELPLLGFAFGLAGVTLLGLPPSGGFSAKFLLAQSAVEQGRAVWAVVLVAGGLLAAGYVFAVLAATVRAPRAPLRLRPVPRTLQVTAFALAAASIALGFAGEAAIDLLRAGAPFKGAVR